MLDRAPGEVAAAAAGARLARLGAEEVHFELVTRIGRRQGGDAGRLVRRNLRVDDGDDARGVNAESAELHCL